MIELKKHQYRCEDANEKVTITFELKKSTVVPAVSFTPSGVPLDVKNKVVSIEKVTDLIKLQVDYSFNCTSGGRVKTTVAGSKGGSFSDTVIQPSTPGKAVTAFFTFAPKV